MQVLLSKEEKALFEAAREECLLRIRHDQTTSSPRVRRLLVYLEHHLYDKDLTAARWKAACSIRSNSFGAEFKEDLDSTPYAYLRERRLETATKLLLQSSLLVWQIGHLVGYSDPAVFSRAFQGWADQRPDHFRKAEGWNRGAQRRQLGLPQVVVEWRSALEGEAELKDLLIRANRFETSTPVGKVEKPLTATDVWEKWGAERIWSGIRNRSHLERITVVRLQGDFETTAFFDLLREKSREEGRQDRQVGLEIAELALHSLDLCAKALEDDLANREAEGWISIANARRLLLDFIGADRDFKIAEVCRLQASELDPLVEGELLVTKAALRWSQMSFKKALQLLNQGIDLLRTSNKSPLLAQSLILRSGIHRRFGELERTLADLEEVLSFLDEEAHAFQVVAAHWSLVTSYLSLGKTEFAEAALVAGEQLFRKLDYKVGWCNYWWLKGLVKKAQGADEAAEKCLSKALDGFLELNDRQYSCETLLELASLYLKQGRDCEALDAVSQALPTLEELRIERKAVEAVRLIKDALSAKSLTTSVLGRIHHLVRDLLSDPLTRVILGREARKRDGWKRRPSLPRPKL